MLFHVSLEADDPRHVSKVLAELLGGESMPFPPIDGSWTALAGDDRGTMIEVYPRGTELHDGPDGAIGRIGGSKRHGSVHIAIATPLDAEAVFDIARREEWRAKYCRRGGRFGLIELWVENCLMVEVLTGEMQQEYLDTVTIANWKAMLANRPAAKAA